MRFEATVVGTGFGGAVAACRLSQAGFAPLVLERGRRYEAADFPALPGDPAMLPDFARWSWRSDRGLWDVQDLREILSIQAAGYGGGSLVYANVHLRPPREIFDARWPTVYEHGHALERFYDLAAYMLDVAPFDERPSPVPLVKVDQLKKAATHLGRDAGFFFPPLAINHRRGQNAHGKLQGACTSCGACCTGCPNGAKNTLDLNYLAVAETFGAVVRTQCEVSHVEQLSDGFSVRYQNHITGTEERIETKHLFMCAGAVHTVRLLARAELQDGERLKRNLGVGYFPNADAVGVVYDTEHPQYPSWGPVIASAVAHGGTAGTQARSWFIVQDGGYAPELARAAGMLRGPQWFGRNRFPKPEHASVTASRGQPPAAARAPASVALPSIVDGLLDAWSERAFKQALPRQLAAALPAFLDELAEPLLPAIVERTVERAIVAKLQSSRLTRGLDPHGRVFATALRVAKRVARRAFASTEVLTREAARAVVLGGGLSRTDMAARCLGVSSHGAERRAVLLAMGPDATSGALHYDEKNDGIIAELDLFHLAPLYAEQENLMRDLAGALGGELRLNPAWASLGKPVTVHNQGGCRMSDEPEKGLTNPDGEVHGCPGLFVLDASLLCSSVGVNPSATIAALAERNILRFIRSHTGSPRWPEDSPGEVGARSYAEHVRGAELWAKRAQARNWAVRPPRVEPVPTGSRTVGLAFDEHMVGFVAAVDEDPGEDDARYRELEVRGRAEHPIALALTARIDNLARFFEDMTHTVALTGTITVTLPNETRPRELRTAGYLQLIVPRQKERRLEDPQAIEAQEHATQTPYVSAAVGEQEERFMRYRLAFTVDDAPWSLEGYKRVRDDPGFDAWRDTSTLHIKLSKGASDVASQRSSSAAQESAHTPHAAGAVHVDLPGFLRQLGSIRVEPTVTDPARVTWTITSFAAFFFGSLQRIYLPEFASFLDAFRPIRGFE